MITEIAYELVKYLHDTLPFGDKWAGLVVPMKKMVGTVEKTFPVYINNPTDCDISDFKDLVPDSNRMSVMYCEKIGESEVDQERKGFLMMSQKLRLVVWYNLKKVNEGKYLDEGVMISNITAAIPRTMPNSLFKYSRNVNIFYSGFITGNRVFAGYTYDEVRTQYMTFPYGAVGIDLEIKYTMIPCAADIVPKAGCGTTGNVYPQLLYPLTGITGEYIHMVFTEDMEIPSMPDALSVFSVFCDISGEHDVIEMHYGGWGTHSQKYISIRISGKIQEEDELCILTNNGGMFSKSGKELLPFSDFIIINNSLYSPY